MIYGLRRVFRPLIVYWLFSGLLCSCIEKNPADSAGALTPADRSLGPEYAVAYSPQGKMIAYDYPSPRQRKTGIFYFVWIGAHGYDVPGGNGTIVPPTGIDGTSPFDISELERGHTDISEIPFGPIGAMHHWGKPYLDYYVSNDKWVIRKHAQWLNSAGIDVIFIDLTNGFPYEKTLETLFSVYLDMKAEGSKVPEISFVLNTAPEKVLPVLSSFFANGEYSGLWFRMGGKPFVLAPEGDCRTAYEHQMTFRYCWYDTHGMAGNWWGDGSGKWTWGDMSPQTEVKEEMSVMAASHPLWNVGRSFTGDYFSGGSQPAESTPELRAEARFFRNQWKRAIHCDPDFIFITGWNEWVAQRQQAANTMSFLGKTIRKGDAYFVDCYNHEFSRDIEPCADDFKDTYYYMMAEMVRRYKGVSRVPTVNSRHSIAVDGKFRDWNKVGNRYEDYRNDVINRRHYGFGYKNISLENKSGRNDLLACKICCDAHNLYFYVETAKDITEPEDPLWMRLFIGTDDEEAESWEAFNYMVSTGGRQDLSLYRCDGGWSWRRLCGLSFAKNGRQMELAVPLSELGLYGRDSFTVDFKWIDNAVADGDICNCMTDGDSAPDNRWRYRFLYSHK